MEIVYDDESLRRAMDQLRRLREPRQGGRPVRRAARAGRPVPRGRHRGRRRRDPRPHRRGDHRRRDGARRGGRGALRRLGLRPAALLPLVGDDRGDRGAHAGHRHRARGHRPDQRAVRGQGQPGVRDRGQPAGQPHRALRGQGHRGAAREGRGAGDGRRHPGRAARGGAALPARRRGATSPSRRRSSRSAASPTPTRCSAPRCAARARSWASTPPSASRSPRASWPPAIGCPPAAASSCRSPIATRRSGPRRRGGSSKPGSGSWPPPGTADALEAAQHPRGRRAVAKVGEPTGTDAVELISSGKVDLVVNSPRGRGARADGAHIRAAAAVHGVPCLTTAAAGLAAANGHRRLGVPRARACERCRSSTAASTSTDPPCRGSSCGPSTAPAHVGSAPAGARRRRSQHHGRVGQAPEPGHDRVGHGRPRRRAGALRRPRIPRRRRGQVAVRRSLGGQPARCGCTRRSAGMINSVGLQGPGVEAWLAHDLPPLAATGARIVASIWGRTVAEYEAAAALLADAPASVVAVEVNLSCPNTEAARDLFAHSAAATHDAMAATARCGRPRWAKLSPNVTDLVPIAEAARGRRGGGRDAGQHRPRPGHRPRDRVLPARIGVAGRWSLGARHPPDRRAGRPRRARARCPTCRSSGSAASPREGTPPS